MTNYPPVDPDFYSIGSMSGMSDDEIKKDWEAFCDDLAKFHAENDVKNGDSLPSSKLLDQPDTLSEIKKKFGGESE